jgi:hypothetical protein
VEVDYTNRLFLELNEAALIMPDFYFSSVDQYVGVLLFLIMSLHDTVPGPTKQIHELLEIRDRVELHVFSSREERVRAFAEAKAFYVRVIAPDLEKCRQSGVRKS